MKLSHFLKIWPFHEKPGYNLVYSTKKASLVLLPDSFCQALINEEQIEDEIEDQLAQLGMLVRDHDLEKEEVFGMQAEVNRLFPGLSISVILNLDCNFACRYCYEGTMKDKLYMSDAVADQFIQFVKERYTENKSKIHLDFYGGEPLLSKDRIIYISKALQPFVEERSGTYSFNLVTNGSLLTRKTVKELKPFGIESAKVTIDGLPENHNKYRPFKSGGASFEVILANLKACCKCIEINVSGNYTKENYKDFPLLLNLLMEQGLNQENVGRINFHPVMQTNDKFSLGDFHEGCVSANEPWLFDAWVYLQGEIMKRGFTIPKITPEMCMVAIDDGFTVNYNGEICKCAPMIGHEQFVVGDIWNGIKDFSKTYNLNNWRKEEKCRECEYLPLCFGGCRYAKFQRDGEMAGVDCKRPFFDATLEALVKQGVRI